MSSSPTYTPQATQPQEDYMKALYRYNPITGYWVYVRSCEETTAEEWLRIFQADEPQAKFELRKVKGKS